MKNKAPVFTVITPIYNSGKWVVRAIASLRAQDFPLDKVQHIIIDDGSSDDSVEVVRDYVQETKHACLFLQNEKNLGVCKTLNKALSYADGEFISYLPDDLWKPNKLSSDYECWQRLSTEYGVIHSNFDTCDEEDTILRHNVLHKGATTEDKLKYLLFNGAPFPGTSVSIRKAVFDEVGIYNETLPFEDIEFWIRCALEGVRFYHNNQTTFIYRMHGNGQNLTNKVLYGAKAQIDNIRFRLNLLEEVDDPDVVNTFVHAILWKIIKLLPNQSIISTAEIRDLQTVRDLLQQNNHPLHLFIADWLYHDHYPKNNWRRKLGLIKYILKNG